MKKFTYTKTADFSISIDLQNNFTVIATGLYNKKDDIYNVSLYLKNNEIGTIESMESFEDIKIKSNRKTIYTEILKLVSGLYSDALIDDYIVLYQYSMDCFDKGNEIFEKERLGII